MTSNPDAPSSLAEHRSRSGILIRSHGIPYPWLVASGALASHAALIGIGFIAKVVPESWIPKLLLLFYGTSLVLSLLGALRIRQSLVARILCGMGLLVSLIYTVIVIWSIFFFELPGQD